MVSLSDSYSIFSRSSIMKFSSIARQTLDSVGLGKPARSTLKAYHRGRVGVQKALWDHSLFLPPLVDAAAFVECATNAIAELEGLDHDFGHYLEFGVSRGTSMAAMYRATAETGHGDIRLIGVDFDRTRLVKGWFSDTLTPARVQAHGIKKASLVMIDCDIYSAACEALDFVGPLIGDNAVVFFDDWGWSVERGERGEKEAFDRFLKAHGPFETRELPTYFDKAKVFLVSRV